MSSPDPHASLPRSPDELTPEWLTAALRSSGALTRGRVASFELEPIGGDQGFTGALARARIAYADGGDGPATLIAKFPTLLAKNRGTMQVGDGYAKEVRFYGELAARQPVRVPRCYFHGTDDTSTGGGGRLLEWLERLPLWLLRLVMRLALWAASHSKRRYVLLLEDLAPAAPGDQVQGCDAAGAERPVRALAAFHAANWGPRLSAAPAWVSGIDRGSRIMHSAFLGGRRALVERFHALLPDDVDEAFAFFEAHGLRLSAHLSRAPATLAHGDYRLDNLFFHDGFREPGAVAVIDWQGVFRGPGAIDLAYFLATNLSPGVGPEVERDLVGVYHAALEGHGVEGYSLADCLRHYELSKLLIAYYVVAGSSLLDLGEGRGADLAENIIGRVYARLPARPFDRFLEDVHP